MAFRKPCDVISFLNSFPHLSLCSRFYSNTGSVILHVHAPPTSSSSSSSPSFPKCELTAFCTLWIGGRGTIDVHLACFCVALKMTSLHSDKQPLPRESQSSHPICHSPGKLLLPPLYTNLKCMACHSRGDLDPVSVLKQDNFWWHDSHVQPPIEWSHKPACGLHHCLLSHILGSQVMYIPRPPNLTLFREARNMDWLEKRRQASVWCNVPKCISSPPVVRDFE